jgi:dihydropteroate synthase
LIGIDTTRAAVAAAAIDAGADIINDISAGRDDLAMFDLAAAKNVPIILMHMQGQPATMQRDPQYDDVICDIAAHLLERSALAMQAGVARDRIAIDPGIGFGKTLDHNLELLANLDAFVELGYPVVLGCSRKKFIRAICGIDDASFRDAAQEAIGGACATTALGVAAGVHLFRVHDVKPNRHAADVAKAILSHR